MNAKSRAKSIFVKNNIFLSISLLVIACAITNQAVAEKVFSVKGQVINSISKKPVEGVLVGISIADKQSTEPVLTDEKWAI
ncbi:MAG: hypothetical protein ACP5UA_01260 [Candidatus Hydrogenedens sp.]